MTRSNDHSRKLATVLTLCLGALQASGQAITASSAITYIGSASCESYFTCQTDLCNDAGTYTRGKCGDGYSNSFSGSTLTLTSDNAYTCESGGFCNALAFTGVSSSDTSVTLTASGVTYTAQVEGNCVVVSDSSRTSCKLYYGVTTGTLFGISNSVTCTTGSSVPTCSAAASDDNKNKCFAAGERVNLESGFTKAIEDVKVGDRIQVAAADGTFPFSDVVFLPHLENNKRALFVRVVTGANNSLKMTPNHLLPIAGACGDEIFVVNAKDVAKGDCVFGINGKEKVVAIEKLESNGIYTAVTKEGHGHILVNNITASSFGGRYASLHNVTNYYYNMHRMLYNLLPKSVMQSKSAVRANLAIGDLSVAAAESLP